MLVTRWTVRKQKVKTNAVLRMRPKRAAPTEGVGFGGRRRHGVAHDAAPPEAGVEWRTTFGVPRGIARPASHPRVENGAHGPRVVAKVVGRARGRLFTSLRRTPESWGCHDLAGSLTSRLRGLKIPRSSLTRTPPQPCPLPQEAQVGRAVLQVACHGAKRRGGHGHVRGVPGRDNTRLPSPKGRRDPPLVICTIPHSRYYTTIPRG